MVGAGYWLWTGPLPEDMDQKEMLQVSTAIKKILLLIRVEWLGRVFFGHTNKFQHMRAMLNAVVTPPALDADPDLEVKDLVIGGVPVRIYRPRGMPVPSPVLMHFHGGGFSIGSIKELDFQSRYIARKAQTVVVAVEYRLAPEHPFPAALDDCLTSTVHVLTHGLDLGIDVTRVGVGGFSAGGNLAAALALRLQDKRFQALPRIRYQLLLCPPFQGIDFDLPSSAMEEYAWGVVSSEDRASYYLSYAGLDLSSDNIQQVIHGQQVRPETKAKFAKYVHRDLVAEELKTLGVTTQHSSVSPRPADIPPNVNKTLVALAEPIFTNPLFSPLLADESALKELPTAMVVISGYDMIRDDAILYVRRLRSAGVPVTPVLIHTGHHLSVSIIGEEPGSDVVKDAYDKIIEFIKKSSK